MKSKNVLAVLCLTAAMIMSIFSVSAAEKISAEQSKPLPRVLLIGDSISGGYQGRVKTLVTVPFTNFTRIQHMENRLCIG